MWVNAKYKQKGFKLWPDKGAKWQGQYTKVTAVHFRTQCGGAVASLAVVACDSVHLSMATGPQQDRHACQGTASGLDWHTRRARTGKPGVRCEAGVSLAEGSEGERKK